MQPGQTVSHYRIQDKLGEGGMGVVYKAEDSQLRRIVALKVLPPHLAGDKESRSRFLQEAQAAAALTHPNICTVFEIDLDRGFLAMEMLEGQTIAEKIRARPLKLDEALRIAIEAAQGLQAAHTKGIVHRDIKSANLMVTAEGPVKIMDFGLALVKEGVRLTRTGVSLGTPAYMSPEQALGQSVDHRTDIWSLGVVLYEIVTGQLPFRGELEAALARSITHDEPEPLTALRSGLPVELDRIVGKALAKNPGERYQHVDELLADLRALRRRLESGQQTLGAPVASRRRWIWVAGTGLVAAAAGGAWGVWQLRRPSPGEKRLSRGGRRSKNAQANDYYERAMLGMMQSNPPYMRQMLEGALAMDPQFAEARAEYGFTHLLMLDGGLSNDSEWLYKAEKDIHRALQDDPACGRAHSALLAVYMYQGRKDLALAEGQEAMKLNPNDPDVYNWLALYYSSRGDYAKADALLLRALELFPLFFPARMSRGGIMSEQGDIAGAVRELERVLEQDPANPYASTFLCRAYLDTGQTEMARQSLERIKPADRSSFHFRLMGALLLAVEGRKTEALVTMDDEVLKFARLQWFSSPFVVEFYATLGDARQALEWLEQAARSGDERVEWFRRSPLLASIRKHPRFEQIMQSIEDRRRRTVAQ